MKKFKLLLAAAALMFGGSVWAQTDVTSTYITNADFSSTDGWTAYVSGSYKDYGNGLIGTYGVRTNEGQGVSTIDETHLATEYCFGFEVRWNGNYASFNQTTSELPVGAYTLTYDVENTNSKTSKASYNSLFYVQVGETQYTDSKTEWMNGSSSWTTHTISFNITSASTAIISLGYGTGGNNIGSTNTPTLHVSHLKLFWTDPLKASKDALQAEIDKAKLCDAKEGLADAISAAESVLASATTVAELEQALVDLQAADKDAVLRYENGLADANYSAPVLTSFVVNGTFTDNVSGWTCTGGFQNQARASNQGGAFDVPFFENWNGSAKVNKMYQTINNIPNGTYRLDIAAFVNALADPNESQYVFANSDKVYLTTGEPTAYQVWTVVTTNSIEIGLEQTAAVANWMGIDNVSLRYYGAGDVINGAQNAGHKIAWEEAKAAAEAARDNALYENVTGMEKAALLAEIAKAEPSTAEGYDTATAALAAATSAFIAAKANYDMVAAAGTLAYADPSKKPVITDETTAASLIIPLRAYYESNALAEGVDGAVNMTDRIANANNPTNNDGWTWTGNKNNPASNESWTDADGTNNHSYFDGGNWGANSWTTTMSQNITLPAGTYLLTAKARAAQNTTFTMAVGEVNVTLPHVGSTGNVFDRGWGDASLVFTTEGSGVTITVTASTNTVHEWFSVSDFRLIQLEANNDIALHKQAWEDAKATAEAARDNALYENITGSEKVALLAEIAKAEPSTADDYDAAALALANATEIFIAAKANYDMVAAAGTLAYADPSKKPVITDETTAASLITPLRAYYESNALAEGWAGAVNYEEAIAGADPNTNTEWTGGIGTDNREWENYTDASGNLGGIYYDGGWSANAGVNINMSRSINLPAGSYLLTVTARGSVDLTSYTMAVAGESVNLPTNGGDVNQGVFSHGWDDVSVVFVSDGNPVTLTIAASSDATQQWISFNRFRLMQLEMNTSVYAGEAEYNALNSAIGTAEAKTLGFEDGQFAPYNNVEPLTALAAAKAIDQTAEFTNLKSDVVSLTTALTTSWVANDGDVDAIYNGTFAEANGTNPKGWTRSNNGWGQQITDLSAEANGVAEGTTTAWYYNTNGSWQYGNDGIYVMPLAANQAYELSFKYSKHGSDRQNWMKASVVNSSNEGMEAVEFEAAENGTTFVTAKAYFTTGAAGNYILSIEQYGNAHLTDVSLVKAASATFALNEDVAYEVIDRTYYETVELTRNVVGGFNTVCLPFDLTAEQVASVFGNGAKVYNFEDVADGTNSTINFNTKDDNTITANVPVLIGEATASTDSKIINNVVLKSGEAKVVGTNFDFVGTYATITVAEDDYFIGAGALYKSEGATSMKAFRAYLHAKSAEAKALNFTIDGDDATGINSLTPALSEGEGDIYNLAGQRMGKMKKGINIVNGKKILK